MLAGPVLGVRERIWEEEFYVMVRSWVPSYSIKVWVGEFHMPLTQPRTEWLRGLELP